MVRIGMFLLVFFAFFVQILHGQQIRLAVPKVNGDLIMLNAGDPAQLYYDFRMEGAEVRYSLDGTEPSAQGMLYKDTLLVEKAMTVKARAFHPDFAPSEVIETRFVVAKSADITLAGTPHPKYAASGGATLTDKKFGTADFSKDYLGFEGDTVKIWISPGTMGIVKPQKVHFSTLAQQGSWIFGPSKAELRDQNGTIRTNIALNQYRDAHDPRHDIITLSAPQVDGFWLYIYPQAAIPDWHPGKGNRAWLFVDEVWVE
jgi:hypothetical protein